jgi:hypothetical protein
MAVMASEPVPSVLPGDAAAATTLCLSARQGHCATQETAMSGPAGAVPSVHCSLYQASFSRCLSSAAASVVRRDPGAPPAVAAFKITVKDEVTGATTDTTVLTASASDISDVVGALHYSLNTVVTDDGSARVAFHLTGDGDTSGSRDFVVGDVHTVPMDHAMVTIARL